MKLLDQLKNAVKQVLARRTQRKLDMLLGQHYLKVVVNSIEDWPMFKCYYSQFETFSQLCVKYPSLLRQFEKKMSGRPLPKELLNYLILFNNQAGFPLTISDDLLNDPACLIKTVNALSCKQMAKALADYSFTTDDQAFQVSRLVEHHKKDRYYPSYRQLESKQLNRVDSLDMLNHILSSVPDTWEDVATERSTGAAYVRATVKYYGACGIKNMSPKVACLYGMLSYPFHKRGLSITAQGVIKSSANA